MTDNSFITVGIFSFQFTKCSQIHSIDIGNEGSAFVEILVGKSAATADKDFEVISMNLIC